jgi:hypothetical protein
MEAKTDRQTDKKQVDKSGYRTKGKIISVNNKALRQEREEIRDEPGGAPIYPTNVGCRPSRLILFIYYRSMTRQN